MRKNSAAHKKNTILSLLLIALLTFLVYAGSLRNGFIWDDDDYIYENPLLSRPDGLARIWKSFSVPEYDPEVCTPQYYPLVFTTFYLEHKLWGLNPAGYHLSNILLHAANAVLLFLLLKRLGLSTGLSWVTAALFALHPLQVETVAWATERKNLLSALFYFSAFITFLRYEDSGKAGNYLASVFFFLLALLSKTVTATLPVALVLAAWLRPRPRPLSKTLIKTIPFFLLGAGMGLLTSLVEKVRVGAYGPEWDLSFLQRIIIASRALWFYSGKLVLPRPLSFFYRRWEINAASVGSYLPVLGLAAAALVIWKFRERIGKHIVFGLLYFAVTLAPALGFVNFYPMRYSFVADHFQYLAVWGMLIVLTGVGKWLIEEFFSRRQRMTAAGVLTAVVLFACGCFTGEQVRKYRNEETLWKHTIAACPQAWVAHNNLGVILASRRRCQEAMERYQRTIELNPYFAEAYNNLGVELVLTGRPDEAVRYYRKAIELRPEYMEALYNLAVAYGKLGNSGEAVRFFRETLRLKPEYMGARYNLALTLCEAGRYGEAVHHYLKVIELKPDYAEAHYNLALTYELRGRPERAFPHYRKAIVIKPDYAEAHYCLGLMYQRREEFRPAVYHLRRAVDLRPDYAQAHYELGAVYYLQKEYDLARRHLEIAERLGFALPDDLKQELEN